AVEERHTRIDAERRHLPDDRILDVLKRKPVGRGCAQEVGLLSASDYVGGQLEVAERLRLVVTALWNNPVLNGVCNRPVRDRTVAHLWHGADPEFGAEAFLEIRNQVRIRDGHSSLA